MESNFSFTISKLRKSRGLSQKQVAKDLGVSQALLSHYERGIRECGLDFLMKLSSYYSVSTDFLLGMETQHSADFFNGNQKDTSKQADEIKYQIAKAQKALAKAEKIFEENF